jgi:hypothetical protein
MISFRGGGDPYDDGDNEEYDSDSNDEDEFDHEDEANDPWEEIMPSGSEWDNALIDVSWQLEDPDILEAMDEQQPHLRGGATSDGEQWQRQWEQHVRPIRESAQSPTRSPVHHTLPPHCVPQPDFYDENSHVREDLWRTWYERHKNGNATFVAASEHLVSALTLSFLSPTHLYRIQHHHRRVGQRARSRPYACIADEDDVEETSTMLWLKPRPAPHNVTPASISSRSMHAMSKVFG